MQNTINLTLKYACNLHTDIFIIQKHSIKVCVLIVAFHESILDAIIIGKLEIVKGVILCTFGKPCRITIHVLQLNKEKAENIILC